MFVCLVDATPAASERLRRWQAVAWPEATHATFGRATLITDGRNACKELRLTSVLGAIDGLVWTPGDDAATDPSVRLVAALSEGSWPLPDPLDGSFSALAIDAGARVTVGLDPIGLRRVYLAHTPAGFGVSSLQVPLAAAFGLEADLVGLCQVLGNNHSVGRRTIFSGVRELLPGECWRVDATGATQIGYEPAMIGEGEGEAGAGSAVAGPLAERFVRTVRQMAARSPRLGLALSGGLDSRLVLAGLEAGGRRPHIFAWGSRGDYETAVIERCTKAAGCDMSFLDLQDDMFPTEPAARAWALRTEALLHPAWVGLAPTIGRTGCEIVAMGNVTDSYQVRIAGLWNRRARATRALRRAIGAPEHEISRRPGYRDTEEWWGRLAARLTSASSQAANRFRVDVHPEMIEAGVSEDLHLWRDLADRSGIESAVRTEDMVHLFICRQVHGSQPQSVAYPAVGVDVTASRHLGRAALALAPSVRADRELLQQLARELLPNTLARIPTATIPFVPATSPWQVQAAAWGARYVGDQVVRRVNAYAGGGLGRDRVLNSLDLYAAYRAAGAGHYLGAAWDSSGVFGSQPFVDDFRNVLEGNGVRAMYPFRIQLGLRLDTMLSWAGGPRQS